MCSNSEQQHIKQLKEYIIIMSAYFWPFYPCLLQIHPQEMALCAVSGLASFGECFFKFMLYLSCVCPSPSQILGLYLQFLPVHVHSYCDVYCSHCSWGAVKISILIIILVNDSRTENVQKWSCSANSSPLARIGLGSVQYCRCGFLQD